MSLKDIEKLKEKIEKDPNSKLFVPLAEEYRKEGMLDDAIEVLLNGIGRQPNYISARVSLGKMYFDKGMLKEARTEFENVIKVIPDNLFAHKKLAEIYRETGERDLAIKAYKTVLKLNSMDEDASTSLRDIEGGGPVHEPKPKLPEDEQPPFEETPQHKTDVRETQHEEKVPPSAFGEISPPESPQSVDDVSVLVEALFGDRSGAEDVLPSEIAGEDEILKVIDERSEEISEGISFRDVGESLAISEPDTGDAPCEMETGDAGSAILPEKTRSESQLSAVSHDKGPSMEDAGTKIAEGNYLAAMDVYKRILSTDPGNRKALQSAEELKALLKLMGKDKEALIAGLKVFLDGIKKRRDEFFGNA